MQFLLSRRLPVHPLFRIRMILKLCLLSYIFTSCAGDSVKRPRGVPLSMLSLYPPEGAFTCFDGSLTIPFNQVNDDYCDCVFDGSDEPGTSACPNGSFHCSNKGYKSFFIPSSHVNDGICDCCDGSDEYSSGTSCQNNCNELGQVAREEEARKLAMFKEGNKIRKELCAKGAQMKREKQLRLLELTKEQTEAELLKKEKEDTKNAIEEQEKVALDAHKKLEDEKRKELEEAERIRNEEEALEKFKEFDKNGDGLIQKEEIIGLELLDRDNDGVVSDSEIKMMMGEDESMSFEVFVTNGWQYLKQIFAGENLKEREDISAQQEELTSEHLNEDAEETREEPNEDDEEHEEAGSLEDIESSKIDTLPSHDVKIEYDEALQKLVDEASIARTEYDNAVRNLRDLQREIKQAEDILNKDYGPDDAFAYLVGECFEYTDREYTYKLCPFDQITQRPKDGGSETSLGTWGNWLDEKYDYMHYTQGQSCWNGPQRHTKVKLVCNVRTEVTSAGEPNRCEYSLEFNTPAVCTLKEIEETSNEYHDEL